METLNLVIANGITSAMFILVWYITFGIKVKKAKILKECPTCHRWMKAE